MQPDIEPEAEDPIQTNEGNNTINSNKSNANELAFNIEMDPTYSCLTTEYSNREIVWLLTIQSALCCICNGLAMLQAAPMLHNIGTHDQCIKLVLSKASMHNALSLLAFFAKASMQDALCLLACFTGKQVSIC